MKRYTIINTTNNQIIAENRPYPTDEGAEIVGLDPDWKFLEQVKADRPTYDSMTHKLVEDAITYDIPNAQAIRSWSAVALTQAEIDERTPEHYETSTGIKMATDLQSQAAFSNMMTLLNEAGMADTEMVMIKDCFGASHGMTLADFRTHAVAYGLHCYSLFHSS